MKCPLSEKGMPGVDVVKLMGECVEEQCAWWIKELETCAVKQIGMAFSHKKPESKSNLFHN